MPRKTVSREPEPQAIEPQEAPKKAAKKEPTVEVRCTQTLHQFLVTVPGEGRARARAHRLDAKQYSVADWVNCGEPATIPVSPGGRYLLSYQVKGEGWRLIGEHDMPRLSALTKGPAV